MYLGTFSKILSPGIRLGWVVAPPPVLEKITLGKQEADLCTSTLSQLMVQTYFERGDWLQYVGSLTDIYRDRRDTMLAALEEHFPPQAEWTRPGGGLFIWATLPDFIDTDDLLARALRDNVAFVPGSGAFLDGRGHNAMRLNFSGSGEAEIREGISRIGEVIKEQVELYGTLTGEHEAVELPEPAPDPGADVVELPRRGDREPEGPVSRIAVLKGGRSLERQVSLRSGARVEDALERLGHEVVAIDVGLDLVKRLRDETYDAAFVALHGRDGEDGTVQELLEILGVPYTGSGVLGCSRAMDKVLTKHLLLDAGIPTPDFFAFNQTAFRELGAAEALPAIEERLDFPIVVKPSSQGSALGIKFARTAADVPGGARGGLLLRRARAAGAPRGGPRPRRVGARRPPAAPRRCRWSRRCRARRTSTTSRPATRSAAPTFVCPAELPDEVTARAQELALATYRLLGLYGFGRVDLMLDEDERAVRARGQPDPRPDRDEPPAAGRRGGRHRVRRAGGRGS